MDKGVSLVGVSYNERGLLQIRLMSMNGRTVGTDWYGTGRGTNFWYEILFGTARGIDFRTTYRTIKSRTKNPYNVPKSVPVRIFGTVRPSMVRRFLFPGNISIVSVFPSARDDPKN